MAKKKLTKQQKENIMKINNQRIEQSKKLLTKSAKNLLDICLISGDIPLNKEIKKEFNLTAKDIQILTVLKNSDSFKKVVSYKVLNDMD